jgi:predicted P-loop ATPase
LHHHKFFGDALPPMGTKDASDYIRGKWGIELSELAFQRKADEEAQKAFISRREERFRPAYGREEIRYPRQCVFWGTTNRFEYLTDDSGNRRFLPVKTETINIAALRANRDKLWAEAVYYYRQGEKWWLDGVLLKYAQKQTEKRLESDPWMEQILLKTLDRSEITIREAFVLCFPLKNIDQISNPDRRRMSSCLLKTRWSRAGQYTGGPKRNQAKFVRTKD